MNKGVIQFAAGVVVFIALGTFFTEIYTYFAISIALMAILRPVATFLANIQFFGYRMPRFVSVLLSFSIFALVTIGFFLLFVPLISDQIKVMSTIDYATVSERLGKPLYAIETFLINNELTMESHGFIAKSINADFKQFVAQVDFGNIVNDIFSVAGSFFVGIIAVLFITFFLLNEAEAIRKWFISMISNKYFEVTIAALNKIERLLSNYLLGLSLQMMAIFSLASLGLSIIGINYALTIAMFAAIANIIPYLGPMLGAAFAILVGVTITPDIVTFQDYFLLIAKIISVFAVVQVTDNVVWQPLIFSKSVKAHPLEIFIIIFAGATLAGIVGMIVAIPVYTILRVTFMEFYLGSRKYRIFKMQKLNFN